MTYSFRPAKRSEAKPLIGLYSESGAGKTWSSLLLARGFVGPSGKIGMIETESGRGEAYADLLPGGYVVLPMRDDETAMADMFTPEKFGEAITTAEKENLDALIVDSASSEWEDGVCLMAAANEDAGKRGMMIWQGPKIDHKRHFINRLMGTPIPLVILCMRARYPMEEVLLNGKKVPQRSKVLTPYQSDKILFEMFLHGWIDQAHALHVTKYSRDDWRAIIRDNEPITLETGQRLASWAKGGTTASRDAGTPEPQGSASRTDLGVTAGATSGGGTGGTPLDDWLSAFSAITTLKGAQGLWTDANKVRETFTTNEWDRIERAKDSAKARLAR